MLSNPYEKTSKAMINKRIGSNLRHIEGSPTEFNVGPRRGKSRPRTKEMLAFLGAEINGL